MNNKKQSAEKEDIFHFISELKRISSKTHDKQHKKSISIKPKISYQNTFIIEYASDMNPNLDYSYLIKILKKYGLEPGSDPHANHLFGIISSKYYNTKFYILNNFQFVRVISDKYSLYFNLQLFFPEHYRKCYPNSFLLSNETKYIDIKHKIYIARPISAWSGKDIIIIENEKSFEDAKKLLKQTQYSSGISLTEYVSDLVKFNERKMHLRAYFCITLVNNVFKTYLLNTGGIYIAKEKYQNGEWNNKDIHDTHFGNTGIPLFYPDNLYNNTQPAIKHTDWNIIYENMRENLLYISEIALTNIYKYANSQNAYEVFGCDFFIRDDLKTFLIEINSKNVGYKATEKINKKYFDWIDDIVIKPCIFPNLKIQERPETIPIITKELLNY